ncbi:MAG: fibrobacter succinogenes major paralogous domain-containing protein [Myxococcota bacterium]
MFSEDGSLEDDAAVDAGPVEPPPTGEFTDDRDGRTYTTVTLGTQTWMSENLKYENGYGWVYDNDEETYFETYGYLYNYEQALEVCPEGWHLPSQAEWEALYEYLGGEEVAGGKMKEAGTAHWDEPNTGATNSSGFTALPGGTRYSASSHMDIGTVANFWSSTDNDDTWAYYVQLYHDAERVRPNTYHQHYGFSVRCLQD